MSKLPIFSASTEPCWVLYRVIRVKHYDLVRATRAFRSGGFWTHLLIVNNLLLASIKRAWRKSENKLESALYTY